METFDKYGYQLNAVEKVEETTNAFDKEAFFMVDFVNKRYTKCCVSRKEELNGSELCADIDQYEEEMDLLVKFTDNRLMQQVYAEIEDIRQWDDISKENLNNYLSSDRQLLYDIWKKQSKGIVNAIKKALENWMEEHDFEYFRIHQYKFELEGVQ